MKVERFEHRSSLPVDVHELWRLHTDPATLVALTPSPLLAHHRGYRHPAWEIGS